MGLVWSGDGLCARYDVCERYEMTMAQYLYLVWCLGLGDDKRVSMLYHSMCIQMESSSVVA